MTWAMLFAVALAQAPTPEQRLEQATKSFGASGYARDFKALLESIRTLPPADPRQRKLVCEALALGERSGDSEKVEKDLRALLNTLENEQPSRGSSSSCTPCAPSSAPGGRRSGAPRSRRAFRARRGTQAPPGWR